MKRGLCVSVGNVGLRFANPTYGAGFRQFGGNFWYEHEDPVSFPKCTRRELHTRESRRQLLGIIYKAIPKTVFPRHTPSSFRRKSESRGHLSPRPRLSPGSRGTSLRKPISIPWIFAFAGMTTGGIFKYVVLWAKTAKKISAIIVQSKVLPAHVSVSSTMVLSRALTRVSSLLNQLGLDVHVVHLGRPVHDEVEARLHVAAHQRLNRPFGALGVGDRDL